MGVLDRSRELAEGIFSTQAHLEHMREGVRELRQQVGALADDLQDLELRIVRLETGRDADRRELAADLNHFKSGVERALIRLGQQPASDEHALPTPEREA